MIVCVLSAIVAALVLSPTSAQAQFVCTGTLGVTAVTCTNTTTEPSTPFQRDQTGAFNLNLNSSGISNGIVGTSVDGNVVINNSGTNAADIISTATGIGNATSINSGWIGGLIATSALDGGNALTQNSGTVAGSITTIADVNFNLLSGTATTINSGTVNSIFNVSTSGDAIVTNSGSILYVNCFCAPAGILNEAFGNGHATTTNSGVVNGGIITVTKSGNASALNTGTVNGDIETFSDDGNASFANGGTVNGDVTVIGGVNGGIGNATFFNTGMINAPNAGVTFGAYSGNAVGYNSGLINGGVTGTNFAGGSVTFTNAGTIIGFPGPGGYAIDLSLQGDPSIATTLNILPGSRINGVILLAGDPFFGMPGTAVNIQTGRDISQVLTFGDTCGCGGLVETGSVVNVTGGAPYVISGDTVAWLDPTSFANADKNMVDFTQTMSSLISGRLMSNAPIASTAPLNFAPTSNVVADMTRDAFASVQPLSYTSGDRVPMSPTSVTARDGTSVWAQGFGGARTQRADGLTLRSVNHFYGGMMGVDKMVSSDLRLGGFVGAGELKSTIELNSGDSKSQLVFGGIYGRKWLSSVFVDFALLGGHTRDDSRRTVANNLAPSGFDLAVANYHGWFISPEIAVGTSRPLTSNLSWMPVLRGRYLAVGHSAFAETGSLANLTVASRTAGFFEERAEVSLVQTQTPAVGQFMQVSGTVGMLGLHRTDDANVNSMLLGQTLAFTVPGKKDAFGGFAGTAFEWRDVSGWGLFTSAEYTVRTDASRTLSGRAGVRYGF